MHWASSAHWGVLWWNLASSTCKARLCLKRSSMAAPVLGLLFFGKKLNSHSSNFDQQVFIEMPLIAGFLWGSLHQCHHLMPSAVLGGAGHDAHLRDDKSRANRSKVTFPMSYCWQGVELGFALRSLSSLNSQEFFFLLTSNHFLAQLNQKA